MIYLFNIIAILQTKHEHSINEAVVVNLSHHHIGEKENSLQLEHGTNVMNNGNIGINSNRVNR